ncbi:MAG: hypothetical protein PHE84_01510 [bacterium]|nr:hypothetical protein [bacterium]
MKRSISSFLTMVFIVGALLLPALHRAHCASDHSSHDSGQCSICQLASAAILLTTFSPMATIFQTVIMGHVYVPQVFAPSVVLRGPGQDRAPPVA